MAETTPVPKKMKGRTVAALWLMIAPTAMIIGVFVLFAISNWALGYSYSPAVDGIRVALNVLLWIIGVIGFLSWLPALIVGIVLLTATPKAPTTTEGK